MKHVPIRLGPLALLLAVVSICLILLAILSFTTGQADMRLAERYAATVQERYELEAEGQEYVSIVARGDAPESGQDEINGVLGSLVHETGELQLQFRLEKNARGAYDITAWKFIRDWEEDTSLDNIWTGE